MRIEAMEAGAEGLILRLRSALSVALMKLPSGVRAMTMGEYEGESVAEAEAAVRRPLEDAGEDGFASPSNAFARVFGASTMGASRGLKTPATYSRKKNRPPPSTLRRMRMRGAGPSTVRKAPAFDSLNLQTPSVFGGAVKTKGRGRTGGTTVKKGKKGGKKGGKKKGGKNKTAEADETAVFDDMDELETTISHPIKPAASAEISSISLLDISTCPSSLSSTLNKTGHKKALKLSPASRKRAKVRKLLKDGDAKTKLKVKERIRAARAKKKAAKEALAKSKALAASSAVDELKAELENNPQARATLEQALAEIS